MEDSAEPTPPAGRTSKKKKRSSIASLLEARLAAFGEAFMESIEAQVPADGPKVRRKKEGVGKKMKPKKAKAQAEPEPSPALAATPGKATPGAAPRTAPRPATATVPAHGPRPPPAPSPSPAPLPAAARGPAPSPAPVPAQTPVPATAVGTSAAMDELASTLLAPREHKPVRTMTYAARKRFMSGKVSEIRATAKPKALRLNRGVTSDPQDADFRKVLKEVRDFVMPKLGKKEMRQWEEERIKALGGTIEKRQKMGYPHMQRQGKELEQKRQEKLREEKFLGVSLSLSKHRSTHMIDRLRKQRKEEFKQKKRRIEDVKLLHLGMNAREKRGLVTIPKRSVQRFQKKMSRR